MVECDELVPDIPWPDVLLVTIPLIGGKTLEIGSKYRYIVAVTSPIQFGHYYGWEHEREIRKLVLEYLDPILDREHDIFLDIGSHIGSWTIPMAVIKPKQVYAFDPATMYTDVIRNQIKINQFGGLDLSDRITFVDKAVGDKTGKITYRSLRTSIVFYYMKYGRLAKEDVDKPLVDMIDINNDFIKHRVSDGENIRLIKIDVEGWEVDILNGLTEYLIDHKPEIVVEIHDNEKLGKDIKITEFLAQFGYILKTKRENVYWFSTNITNATT